MRINNRTHTTFNLSLPLALSLSRPYAVSLWALQTRNLDSVRVTMLVFDLICNTRMLNAYNGRSESLAWPAARNLPFCTLGLQPLQV